MRQFFLDFVEFLSITLQTTVPPPDSEELDNFTYRTGKELLMLIAKAHSHKISVLFA